MNQSWSWITENPSWIVHESLQITHKLPWIICKSLINHLQITCESLEIICRLLMNHHKSQQITHKLLMNQLQIPHESLQISHESQLNMEVFFYLWVIYESFESDKFTSGFMCLVRNSKRSKMEAIITQLFLQTAMMESSQTGEKFWLGKKHYKIQLLNSRL